MRNRLFRECILVLTVLLVGCGSPEQDTEVSGSQVPEAGASEAGAQEQAKAPAEAELSEVVVVVEQDVDPRLAAIADGSHRSEENRSRNQFRHPVETLTFFGLRPDSQVVEIWPSGGWYTEVIAPYVNEQGKYYAAHWDANSDIEFIQRGVQAYQAKLAENPELYGNVEMTVLMPPDHVEIAPPGSVDLVVAFRNIHNWMPRGSQEVILGAIYSALKPGGVLGIVEHRGDPQVEQDPEAKTGYVNQAYAVELAQKAGFIFDNSSEINANPADTKDYEAGVWTLPPTLKLKEQDQARYIEIGESDRFTLRFIKPAATE
jgi:predicted methyltransferase